MSAHFNGGFDKKKGLCIEVRNGNIEGAIRMLGRKLKNEGVLKELRAKQYYEKPSVAKRRRKAEGIARAAKMRAKNAGL